jgi:hypothetical protein
MVFLRRTAGLMACVAFGLAAATCELWADEPVMHYEHAGALPPGAIGGRALERGGPLPGYFQPVAIEAPPGASIAFATEDHFLPEAPAPGRAAFLIGSVYRLRVTKIPRHEGEEVFPTIELVDRTYPPLGQELRFPIPIDLAPQDLNLALSGHFVTRIIYIEDPKLALPASLAGTHQNWFDVRPQDDPLVIAGQLGRPVAILRIGGRVPGNPDAPDPEFLYHSPPMLLIHGDSVEALPHACPSASPSDEPQVVQP